MAPDNHDNTTYDALSAAHLGEEDIWKRVEALIAYTRVRPGMMAKRFNQAKVPAVHGGDWTWQDVYSIKQRHRATFRAEQMTKCRMRVGRSGHWEPG